MGLSARGLENIQSLKGQLLKEDSFKSDNKNNHHHLKESSLRSCPSFDGCHLKVFFADATTSFNFSVLSVLNGGDAQKAVSGA